MGRSPNIGCYVALIGTLVGAPGSHAQQGEPFENDYFGFRVWVPAGFSVISPGGLASEPVVFGRSGTSDSTIEIFTFAVEPIDDVPSAQAEIATALREAFPELINMRETPMSHQGYPGLEVMAAMDAAEGFYHVVVWAMFASDRLYLISCSSYENRFLRDLPLFRQTLASFEVMTPGAQGSRWVIPTLGNALVPLPVLMLLVVAIIVGWLKIRRMAIARLESEGRWPPPPINVG